ncbi:hypothetical protein F4777DRAFT_541494 [Nemania sp. FL0916]|nr:hypothetical protein F4777DRAFT_541494 [Nemania sp. FL0916]
MATTFNLFGHLPVELRIQVWALAASPRILHVRVIPKLSDSLPGRADFGYASPIAPPAVLHVCQESRQNSSYQKAFFTTSTLAGEPETRYIWVNFEQDMICLADHRVERLTPHEADIQRLRFTTPTGDYGDQFYSYFFHNSNRMLQRFPALRELHIAISEAFLVWGSTVNGVGYANCSRDNVKFLDLHTGLSLTGPQLEMAYNWSEEQGGRIIDVDDLDEEIRFALDNETGLNLSELADID